MTQGKSVRAVVAVLVAGMLLGACGDADGGPPRAEGVVIEVDGDLLEVRSFVMLTDDGERLTFVPEPGLRFNDGAPLSHLQEHATFGTAVIVDYEDDGGRLVAVAVRDA